MPPIGEYSLYFHVPFCTKKCDYCHFYVIPDKKQFKEIYLKALRKEWLLKSSLLPSSKPVSIYFGGGTPALLGAAPIKEILDWVSPSSDCEITLEANPENVSLSLMQEFCTAGINRVSLGVQSLDDALLHTLSRTHSASRCIQAVEDTAAAGIDNISIDLMYDLPGQSLQTWKTTLSHAVQLTITHLSLYNLTIEPHTVFFKKKKSLVLPQPKTSLDMLQTAIEIFEKNGLMRYEISAFAKNGKISKHNTGYWKARPFLGLGPSAFSDWNQTRFRNVSNLHRWAKMLEAGLDPIDFKEQLSVKERAKELFAIRLRLLEGANIPEDFISGITRLQELGLLEQQDSIVRLTQKGLLFHDTVAEEIMSW